MLNTTGHYVWTLTYKWVTPGHVNKPTKRLITSYLGEFNIFRNDHSRQIT